MFDVLRNQYRLRCATTDDAAWIAISSFRSIKRLRGATSPAVFRVEFDCTCGERHESLITHDRLDWEPLGTEVTATFTNLLTGSRELLAHELSAVAAAQLKQGKWPWTFWCHPESAPRPGFPSSLRIVAPIDETARRTSEDEVLGVLVRCFSCARMTVNLVSRRHLDVPYYNDRRIHYVDSLVADEQMTGEEAFRHELWSGSFRSQLLDEAS